MSNSDAGADGGSPIRYRNRAAAVIDVDIDDIDRQIIAHLRGDGRKAFSQIAEEVGISPPTVSDRVHSLQEAGVIEITADVDPVVDTVEISTASLERLLAHAQATRSDPGAPWFDADSQAVREAVEALDAYESALDEAQSEDDAPELVTDGGRTRELSEGDEVTSLQCERCGESPIASDQLRGRHGDQIDLECPAEDCTATGRILRTNFNGEESVRGPFKPSVPDDLGEFLATSEGRSKLPCRECGEQVRRQRLESRVCPHCRYEPGETESETDASDVRRARRGQAPPIDIVAMLIALGLLAGSLLLFGYALVVPGVVA